MTTNEPNTQVSANTRPCWFPQCPNLVPQSPNGRAKLTCDQVVDGLLHSRMNKSLVERGQRSVPPRGSVKAPAVMQAASPGEVERPVTEARDTMGKLMGEVQGAVTGLAPLVARMEAAAQIVQDQEKVTAEINAVQRAARKAVDEAEAVRDAALLRARDLTEELAEARVAQKLAEEVADTALEGEDVAKEQRDVAIGERDAARAAETGQRDRAEGAEAELVEVKAGLARAGERAEMLVDQVNSANKQASAADQVAGELRGEVTMLSDRLAAMTQNAEQAEGRFRDEAAKLVTAEAEITRQQHDLAKTDRDLAEALARIEQLAQEQAALSRDLSAARELAAQQGAQLAAANEATTTAREHGEQRLRDVNELHAEAMKAIRSELAETRKQLHTERDLVATEQRTRVEVEAKLGAVQSELAKVQEAGRGDAEPVDEHQAQPQHAAPTQPTTRRVRRSGK